MGKNFNIIAIHILPACASHIHKVLNANEWYFFNKKYKVINGSLEINQSYSFPDNFYSDKINIQAIVGKNGCGKSSIIEIMLRLINNLAYDLISKANSDTDLHFVNEINVELFYEIDNILNSLKCNNNKVSLDQGNGYIRVGKYLDLNDDKYSSTIGQIVYLKEAMPLLQKFFFTIVNNYSFHSYNALDFTEEYEDSEHVWINGIFHKNDGYLTPIVLNPYRNFGIVNTESEKQLTNIRLASLFYVFKKEGINFLDDYEYSHLSFDFNIHYIINKYKTKININKDNVSNNLEDYIVTVNNKNDDVFNTTLRCYFNKVDNNKVLIHAYKYLVYKTFSISEKYPNYNPYISLALLNFNDKCSEMEANNIRALVDKIKCDTSHVSIKIRQTLKYIDYIINKNPKKDITKLDEDYIKYEPRDFSINDNLTNLDGTIVSLPPPFYKITISIKTPKNEVITFNKMSSGERQFLYYMSTLLYHLKNIDSVINDDESIQYKYVNIILEEVELYFHPEYQRIFVDKLIKYINACGFKNIDYFNILIATHSPFILSDIPKENIMFLENGVQVNDTSDLETFGANIHDMLKNSFFLKEGLVGEFAKKKIKKVIEFLVNDKNQDQITQIQALQIIKMIGEPLIKERLLSIYNDKYNVYEIESLERKINELKAKPKKINNEKNIN